MSCTSSTTIHHWRDHINEVPLIHTPEVMDSPNTGSAKRSHPESRPEFINNSGQKKRRNKGSNLPVNEVVYRVLCPGSKIGTVIGKGGSVIKSLREETGVTIKVADGLPGADERVIFVSTSGSKRTHNKHDKAEGSGGPFKALGEGFLPPVLEAFLKVHVKIFDVEDVSCEVEEDPSPIVTTRLLVPQNQIGCLLGKGGKIIEQMRSETTAQIKVFSKEKLPICAFPDDQLVQISGSWRVVRQALYAVGFLIHESPSRDRVSRGNLLSKISSGGVHAAGPLFYSKGSGSTGPFVAVPLASLGSIATGVAGRWPCSSSELNATSSLSGSHENQNNLPKEEFVTCILCPEEKVGSIIGRGGHLIRQIREETRAKIKIEDLVSESDERVIRISSTEAPTSTISPTLQAALELQSRIAELIKETVSSSFNTRLLVPKKDMGCLLGMDGNVITEMRRSSGADIQVLPNTSVPQCASDADELVQITGSSDVSRAALMEILSRLRDNLFKQYLHNTGLEEATKHPIPLGHGPSVDQPHMSSDIAGLDAQTAFNPSYESYGTSSGTWSYQGLGGSSGLESLPAYGTGSAKLSGPYGSSAILASVASETLEVVIPSSAFSAIFGEGGTNIDHIQKVSDAKIKLHDMKPGASQRVIEIFGTPEQTRTAQSLLEAFADAQASF